MSYRKHLISTVEWIIMLKMLHIHSEYNVNKTLIQRTARFLYGEPQDAIFDEFSAKTDLLK